MKTKKHPVRKFLTAIAIILVALLVFAVVAVGILFGREIISLSSIERIDGTNFYTMTYSGDYGFDDFLESGGASSDSEVVDFVVDRILKGFSTDFELPDLGCSTLFVEKEGGGYLFGRNFDMYDSPAMLLFTEPDDGYRSISMVNLAYIGYSADNLPDGLTSSISTLAGPYAPIDGMNEKGLCVSVMLIDTDCTDQDNGLDDITTTTAIRLMLDKAATVDEAISLLEQYDMHSSAGSCYHFEIADAQGDVAVVEYVEDEMSVIESNYATNFLLTEGDWSFGGGYDRYDTLEEAYEESEGVMSVEELTDAMRSVVQTSTATSDISTQWTCIYDLSELTVTVYYQMDFENGYTYSFD